MTVITKAVLEKKPADKMEQPLVVDELAENKGDPEAQQPQRDMAGHYLILRRIRPSLGPNSMTLYCLLFTALLGMSIGVIGGVYIYKRYAREQMHRFRTGWYSIPYERMENKLPLLSDAFAGIPSDNDIFKTLARDTEREALVLEKSADNAIRNFFQESFEIDLENEHYEGIDVPDFRGGRRGRFIHDFNINLTGIIDIDGQSCFVMPLDRQKVLQPKNMTDLLRKMSNGYYEVNTETVRETMKATFPAISNRASVGTSIARECKRMPIYQLEKINNYNNGMVKRSVDGAVFGSFAGKHIVEIHIANMADVPGQAK